MADAIIRASLVPKGAAQDITTLTATPDSLIEAIDAVSGTDAVLADIGIDNVVSIDVTVNDASASTAEAVIASVLATTYPAASGTTIGDFVELAQGSVVLVEADPTLAVTSPTHPGRAITEDGTDRLIVVVDPTLFGSNSLSVVTVTTSELAAVDIPVAIRGLPNGHESQKVAYPPGRLILKVGPAPDTTAGEYDIVVDVTDGNGREVATALTFQVYVSAGAGPALDSDDVDDALSLADNAAADTTILTATSDTPVTFELVSALTQTTGEDDISAIVTLDDQADWDGAEQTCELIIDPVNVTVNPEGVYDIVLRTTDGLGLTADYTLELTIT